MDNQHFRGILLKLQDRLSDNDRKRLHFFFGNDVPRRIRDDPSLGGTLNLMESLFDLDMISEQDFTVLINAFTEIRCLDAVRLLKNYMDDMESNEAKPTLERLSSIMPCTAMVLEDQVDDSFRVQPTDSVFLPKICAVNKTAIDSNSTDINPFILTHNPKSKPHFLSAGKNFLAKTSIIQMCLVLFTIVLIVVVALLTGFYIHRTYHFNALEKELEKKNQIIIDEQVKNNKSNEANQILLGKINSFEKEQSTSLIRSGTHFGGFGGTAFDDSFQNNFTCSHYLRGVIAQRGFCSSNWFQFLYSSSDSPENITEGAVRGTLQEEASPERFVLDEDERINKVQVIHHSVSYYIGGILKSIPMIRGIRLFTTKGRMSPPLNKDDGIIDTEEFTGYTVGYVSGRAGLGVDQLQFHWYRTVTD